MHMLTSILFKALYDIILLIYIEYIIIVSISSYGIYDAYTLHIIIFISSYIYIYNF